PRRRQARRQPHAGAGPLGGAPPHRPGREPAADLLQPPGGPMSTMPIDTRPPRRRGLRALGAALREALQWRLLLLWLLATLLPTLLATLPLWTALQAQFGHTVHAGDIAAGGSAGLLLQGLGNLGESA